MAAAKKTRAVQALRPAGAEEKASVLTIRVPHELKERIETVAEQQGVSINQFALYAFTKQLSELEDSAYYRQFIRNKTRSDILAGFDATMGKVQYRLPEEGWDALYVAESDAFADFGRRPAGGAGSTR